MRNDNKAQTKLKSTINKHYGVDYAMQSAMIKQRSIETCQKKYGVNNVMQNKDIAFMNSLKHRDPHIDHEQTLKSWAHKLNIDKSVQTIINNTTCLTLNNNAIWIQDFIDKIPPTNITCIYPWFTPDTAIQHIYKAKKQTLPYPCSLIRLNKDYGYQYFREHSTDILSQNPDHMFLAMYADNAIYDAISITQDKDNNYYVDAKIGNYDAMQQYVNFSYNLGIEIKYIVSLEPTTHMTSIEKIVWFKNTERFFDDERKEARYKLLDKGYKPVKVIIYVLKNSTTPTFSYQDELKDMSLL